METEVGKQDYNLIVLSLLLVLLLPFSLYILFAPSNQGEKEFITSARKESTTLIVGGGGWGLGFGGCGVGKRRGEREY